MVPVKLQNVISDERGLAILEYALILLIVIMPVAVIMLAAYYRVIDVEFVTGLIDDFLFRFHFPFWEHPIGAFTYF